MWSQSRADGSWARNLRVWVLLLAVAGLGSPSQAAGLITEVSWQVFNGTLSNGGEDNIIGTNLSDSVSGDGAFVGIGLGADDLRLPFGSGRSGPLPALVGSAEIDGRRLRAYSEVTYGGSSCELDGVVDAGCGVSLANVVWGTSASVSSRAVLIDDITIDGGAALDGLSGLLQIPVQLDGRLFGDKLGVPGASALVQTTFTGRTLTPLAGVPEEDLIDSLGIVNVRFVFGEETTYNLSLQAQASGPGQFDSITDRSTTISDFSSTAEIQQVTSVRVDTDGNGSLETVLSDGFAIRSALGIDYLSVPEPGLALWGVIAIAFGARRFAPRRSST